MLIYIHKEEQLDDVERKYPARHYVFVDDKLRLLTAVKKIWGSRLTTVFPPAGTLRERPRRDQQISAGRHFNRFHRRPFEVRPARSGDRRFVSVGRSVSDVLNKG